MRKVMLAGVSALAAAAFFAAAPAPASASCSTVIEELGCIENVVCGAVGTAYDKVPVKLGDLNCIQ